MGKEEIIKQHEEIMDALFPIGKARWIKVVFEDRNKCIKAFSMYDKTDGYTIEAIGVQDEYIPQIQAIEDLWTLIYYKLAEKLSDLELKDMRDVFFRKSEELKESVIRENGII